MPLHSRAPSEGISRQLPGAHTTCELILFYLQPCAELPIIRVQLDNSLSNQNNAPIFLASSDIWARSYAQDHRPTHHGCPQGAASPRLRSSPAARSSGFRDVTVRGETRSANRTSWATQDASEGSAAPSTSASPSHGQGDGERAAASELIWQCAGRLAPRFMEIDRLISANIARVQRAYAEERIGPHHFQGSTGYGHGDLGRASLDAAFARIFGAEAALVRPQFMSGTHAIATALYACLRPGDEMICAAGHPYDTLEEVIGMRSSGVADVGSLRDFGISYREIDLAPTGGIDLAAVEAAVGPRTRVVEIQRSCGYALRPTLSVEEIGECIRVIKGKVCGTRRSSDETLFLEVSLAVSVMSIRFLFVPAGNSPSALASTGHARQMPSCGVCRSPTAWFWLTTATASSRKSSSRRRLGRTSAWGP